MHDAHKNTVSSLGNFITVAKVGGFCFHQVEAMV